MERRKFLVGMGSLAAGAAAATGTGAFTSVSADREVTVSVAGDQRAFLGIKDTSEYAKEATSGKDEGELQLDFSGGFGAQGGDGLNTNAETGISGAFKIQNRGSNTVRVWIATNDYDAAGATSVETVAGDEGNVGTSQGDNSAVDISYPDSQAGASGTELSKNGPSRAPGGYVVLQSGEETSVDINFFVNSADPQTWYKEWQINADTEAPSPSDYQDDQLQGHGGDTLTTPVEE